MAEDGSSWSYTVRASRMERYEVRMSPGLLADDNHALAAALDVESSLLVVTTPTVDRIYGAQIRRYLELHVPGCSKTHVVLPCTESDKSIEKVLEVCTRAAEAGLARRSQILCVGGGVLLDIGGLAATLFKRGVPHFRIPTTLIGMIDAGIGVKNAVNYNDEKSLIGTFTPPEACFIDPAFLRSLPRRHLQCGLAELLKIAIMCSPELFMTFEAEAERLVPGPIGLGGTAGAELIQLAAQWTLRELDLNLFERRELFERESYARKLDFGHTFSPYIETSSLHRVLHGEAVAIDIAISTEIAYRMGYIAESARTRILEALVVVGLPVHREGLDATPLYDSLRAVVRHRNGNLNLPLPTRIGEAVFLRDLEALDPGLLAEVISSLAGYEADVSRGFAGPLEARRIAETGESHPVDV